MSSIRLFVCLYAGTICWKPGGYQAAHRWREGQWAILIVCSPTILLNLCSSLSRVPFMYAIWKLNLDCKTQQSKEPNSQANGRIDGDDGDRKITSLAEQLSNWIGIRVGNNQCRMRGEQNNERVLAVWNHDSRVQDKTEWLDGHFKLTSMLCQTEI